MGPWFEPGPGSHFSSVFRSNSIAYVGLYFGNHRLLVFRSPKIGPDRRYHDPSAGGSSPPGPLCPWVHHPSLLKSIGYVDFRRWTRGLLFHWSVEGRVGCRTKWRGGEGGEENSKKRTLRFLHWGSVVDPQQWDGLLLTYRHRCAKLRLLTFQLTTKRSPL